MRRDIDESKDILTDEDRKTSGATKKSDRLVSLMEDLKELASYPEEPSGSLRGV